MLLDTGAERSVITRAAVARLKLALDPWVGSALRGAGGRIDEHQNAVVHTAMIGDTRLYQRAPGTALSLPVSALDLEGVDGLLGSDMLRHHSVTLDLAAGQLQFDAPPVSSARIRLEKFRLNLLLVPVTLDGHRLAALVDTGASISFINARGLFQLGLTAAALARDPVVQSAAIGGSFTARRHRFVSLKLGGLTIPNAELLAAEVPQPGFDMVLGLDALSRQPFTLSYEGLWLAIV